MSVFIRKSTKLPCQNRDNFTSPVCATLVITLLDGELCYELDVGKTQVNNKATNNDGLVLLPDLSQQRSGAINSPGEIEERLADISNRLVFESVESDQKDMHAQIYINTIQFIQDLVIHDSQYIWPHPIHITGTVNFLSLDNPQKLCSVDMFSLMQYVKHLYYI